VAEEFALNQSRRDRAAIDFDERAIFARAQVVNGAGEKFLARSRLAEDEDSGACGGDLLDQVKGFLERGALADDLSKIMAGFDILIEMRFSD